MIRLLDKASPLIKYLCYSILVTIIDVVIVWILYRPFHINILAANTVGVVTGFLVHYLLASKSVFNLNYGVIGFIIYLSTFLLGLILANGLIYIGEFSLFKSMPINISFLLSKGLSIVVPFFVLYFLRKYLYGIVKNKIYEDVVYGKQ